MAAFKLEKLALTLSKLPGPTHQSVLRMPICMLTVLLCCLVLGRRYGIAD